MFTFDLHLGLILVGKLLVESNRNRDSNGLIIRTLIIPNKRQFQQGGLHSSVYHQIPRFFHLCSAPFNTGFIFKLVAWWLQLSHGPIQTWQHSEKEDEHLYCISFTDLKNRFAEARQQTSPLVSSCLLGQEKVTCQHEWDSYHCLPVIFQNGEGVRVLGSLWHWLLQLCTFISSRVYYFSSVF